MKWVALKMLRVDETSKVWCQIMKPEAKCVLLNHTQLLIRLIEITLIVCVAGISSSRSIRFDVLKVWCRPNDAVGINGR